MAYQWFITAWANHQPTTTRATQQPTAPMINQLPIDPQDLRNAARSMLHNAIISLYHSPAIQSSSRPPHDNGHSIACVKAAAKRSLSAMEAVARGEPPTTPEMTDFKHCVEEGVRAVWEPGKERCEAIPSEEELDEDEVVYQECRRRLKHEETLEALVGEGEVVCGKCGGEGAGVEEVVESR